MIDKNNIKCRYYSSYVETVDNLGGGIDGWDCFYKGDKDLSDIDGCSPQCPAYEPEKTITCQACGNELYEGDACETCWYNSYLEDKKIAEEYYANKVGGSK